MINYGSIDLSIQTNLEQNDFNIKPTRSRFVLPIKGIIERANILATAEEGFDTHYELLYFNSGAKEVRIYIVDFQQTPFILNTINDVIKVPEIRNFSGIYTAYFCINGQLFKSFSRTATFKPGKLVSFFDRSTLSTSEAQYEKSNEKWEEGIFFSFQDPEERLSPDWTRD